MHSKYIHTNEPLVILFNIPLCGRHGNHAFYYCYEVWCNNIFFIKSVPLDLLRKPIVWASAKTFKLHFSAMIVVSLYYLLEGRLRGKSKVYFQSLKLDTESFIKSIL